MTEQHGNTGKRNAAKEETKASFIQIRCSQREKSEIVRQLRDNEKLSQFMLEAAAEKIKKRKERQQS